MNYILKGGTVVGSSVSCEAKPGTTGSRFNERGVFRKLCARSAAGTERSRRR